MNKTISILGRKGGTGKSTIARSLLVRARERFRDRSSALIDADIGQHTALAWAQRRSENGLEEVRCLQVSSRAETLHWSKDFGITIVDGPPGTDSLSRDLAKSSSLIVIPSGPSLDDLETSVRYGHECYEVSRGKTAIIFVLIKVDSEREIAQAKEYIVRSGHQVLSGTIPSRVSIRDALDAGRGLSEIPFSTLRASGSALLDELYDELGKDLKW